MNYSQIILDNIKKIAKQRKISLTQIIKEYNFGQNYFVNWKKQNSLPDLEKLIKISEYLNVSVDELIYGPKEKANEINLSEQEKALLNIFRETNEKGRMQIIATIINLTNEINILEEKEKKDS